jgi:hypothetical protein
MMDRHAALDVALDMAQRPLLARQAQSQPLPSDVLQLIRIAAQSDEDIVWASRTRARSTSEVRQAAVMFLQQVLFHPRADSLRLMGLGPDATLQELHEHRKWLLKWLHPDRNPDKWERQLFKRVLDASREAQSLLTAKDPPAIAMLPPRRSRRRHNRISIHPRMHPNKSKSTANYRGLRRYIRTACYAVFTFALVAIGWQLWSGQPLAEIAAVRDAWLDW